MNLRPPGMHHSQPGLLKVLESWRCGRHVYAFKAQLLAQAVSRVNCCIMSCPPYTPSCPPPTHTRTQPRVTTPRSHPPCPSLPAQPSHLSALCFCLISSRIRRRVAVSCSRVCVCNTPQHSSAAAVVPAHPQPGYGRPYRRACAETGLQTYALRQQQPEDLRKHTIWPWHVRTHTTSHAHILLNGAVRLVRPWHADA